VEEMFVIAFADVLKVFSQLRCHLVPLCCPGP
jgi:hypothetical protein